MMSNSLRRIFLSIFLCAFSLLIAAGKVLTVGPSVGQYEKIQLAIDAASEGDTVKILPGIYNENITINKNITIEGTSRDEVFIKAASIESPTVFFKGVSNFSLANISVETEGLAVNVSRSTGKIVNSLIAGGRFGVSFSGNGMTLSIVDSYITSLAGMGNDEHLSTHLAGIYSYGETNLEVERTTFERTGTGVSLSNGVKFTIKNSAFNKNTIGAAINGTATGSLIGNTITGNMENGVLLNNASLVTLINNVFYNNSGHGLDLYLVECMECGCGGTEFKGTVVGSGNLFDSPEEICPIYYWKEDFFIIKPGLGD